MLFYAVTVSCIIYIETSGKFRSGPCSPNLDVFAPLLLLMVNIILSAISLLKVMAKKGNKFLLLINLAVLLALVATLLIF